MQGEQINNRGEIAFTVDMVGSGITSSNNTAVFTVKGDQIRQVAREGALIPGLSGKTFGEFRSASLTQHGDIIFAGAIPPPIAPTPTKGIWRDEGGVVSMLAVSNSPLADLPSGTTFDVFDTVEVNRGGVVAFQGTLASPVPLFERKALWTNRNGVLEAVARQGSPAPGFPAGAKFDYFHPTDITFVPTANVAVGPSGQIAYRAGVSGTGINGANNDGIWLNESGVNRLLLREGGTAPGLPAGVIIDEFLGVDIEPNGAVIVGTKLFDAASRIDNYATFIEINGTLSLSGLTGQSAPGLGAFTKFHGGGSPIFNSAGQGVFPHGLVDGFNAVPRASLWWGSTFAESLIAREGQIAPGTNAEFAAIYPPMINEAGQVLFWARLGTGADSTNDAGIWMASHRGLELVLREGDQIETAPGVARTVSRISEFGSDLHMEMSSFNDHGEFVFEASFTDGTSGLLVGDISPVPETSSLMPALIFWCCGMRTARGKRCHGRATR